MGQIQSKGSYAADAEANTASLTWNSHLSHSKKKIHLPHSEQGHITRYWQIGYIGPVTLNPWPLQIISGALLLMALSGYGIAIH